MKHRILVISSANMDFVMRVSRVPDGGQTVIESHGYEYVPGGKGANSALALARLGADSVFCSRVGNDSHGQKLKQLYAENGIDTRFMITDKGAATGLASIIVDDSGENRIIVYPGANGRLTVDDVEDAMTCIPDAVFLHFEIPDAAVIAATKFAEQKGIPVFIDAGPARAGYPLEKLGKVEVFSPNESETLALTGILPNNPTNCLRAASVLMQKVECKYVVIKLGGRGAYIHDGTYSQHITTYEGEVVDTTAAGDAFTASLTLEYLKTGDITHAVKYANAVGTIVVGRPGASSSLPTAAEVDKFIRDNGIVL